MKELTPGKITCQVRLSVKPSVILQKIYHRRKFFGSNLKVSLSETLGQKESDSPIRKSSQLTIVFIQYITQHIYILCIFSVPNHSITGSISVHNPPSDKTISGLDSSWNPPQDIRNIKR